MPNPLQSGLLAAMVLFTASGCQGGGGKPPTAVPAQSQVGLVNTLWKLVRLGDESLKPIPAAREIAFTLTPEKRVHGSTGCNRMMGGYTLEGDALSFGQLATTRMACADPEVSRREMAFLKALEETTHWGRRGETLELYDSLDKPLARFESLHPR